MLAFPSGAFSAENYDAQLSTPWPEASHSPNGADECKMPLQVLLPDLP
jgi:hypothetical protein